MAKSKEDVEVKVDGVLANDDPENTVVYHLDKDLNDPRNLTPAGALPSLNDEDQQ